MQYNLPSTLTESILPGVSSKMNNTQYNSTSFDPRHLRHLYRHIWSCPSSDFKSETDYYSQSGEDAALHKNIFKDSLSHRNPGIFVELGALDGVTYSNTLFFERMFDWRGVLIEAQPDNARKLLRVNRTKTVKIPFGICSLPQTDIQMLGEGNAVAGDIATMDESFKNTWHKNKNKTRKVACGPIGTYLSAIGITHIDFFSLDVEGAELSVLFTMNWNIQIHYLLVENNSKMGNITTLLKNYGFRIQEFSHCIPGRDCASNTLFVNDNYKRPDFLSICLPNIYPDINSYA
ncbi:unnamed protein product [Adineta steineri]|uniref:Methyltransferase FkbM domain-containing protein n=2 Tax=Adineta steineri TaxID=433720 RepID=A0A819FJB6_9BILA|nr:unnamed protein product [Adineta steineri]